MTKNERERPTSFSGHEGEFTCLLMLSQDLHWLNEDDQHLFPILNIELSN